MQRVLLIDDPVNCPKGVEMEVEDVRPFLMERFAQWPRTAHIFDGPIAKTNDVTPRCEADVDRLATYDRLAVVVYPEHIAVIAIIAAVVAVVVALASFFLLPKIDAGNTQTASPNNGLSERVNRPRPGARIPDIFGTVISVPDLLGAPYRVYDEHRQLEISYMCVGRGAYEIDQVRDGDTLIENISGSSVAIYGPYDSPNGGDTPQLQIGTAIGDPVFNVRRLNEVNGQVLKAPNDEAVRADAEIWFEDGGIIRAGPGIDFTEFFEPDDDIDLGNTGTSAQTPPIAIFAPAKGSLNSGSPGKLIFTGYDPTADFEVGQSVLLGQAVWVNTSYSGSGDLGGGTDGGGPDNPNWPEAIFPDAPIE